MDEAKLLSFTGFSDLTGYFLGGPMAPTLPRAEAAVEPKGTAKQVIFLFLQGAPSPPDTFDFKMTPDTPGDFSPETINGIQFPVGLLPNTAQILDKIAIIRSGLSWALAHNLAQTWFQIGRSPVSATGGIAPHVGKRSRHRMGAFAAARSDFPEFRRSQREQHRRGRDTFRSLWARSRRDLPSRD